MLKQRVRWLVLLLVAVHFFELSWALKYTQPFPAFFFPSFAEIPSVKKGLTKPRLFAFYTNQDSVEVNPVAFFHYLPDVYCNVILRKNFHRENSFIKNTNRDQGITLTQNNGLNHTAALEQKKIQQGITWIKGSLKRMFARDDFAKLEVQWYKYQLPENRKRTLTANKPTEELVIPLK